MSNRLEFFSHRALEREVADRFLNVSMPGASNPGIISPVAATQTISISGSSSGETGDALVVNGISVPYVPSTTDTLTAAAIVAAVNGSAAAKFVTASNVTTTVTLTANLTPTQNGAQGNAITLTGTGTQTGITINGATLTGGLTGLLPLPENKGILAMYQLNAGYYMLVLQDNFKALLASDWDFQVNSATPPAVDAAWTVVDNVQSRSTGYALLASMVNADTITVGNITFTCTTAAQASNVTFQVGANDAATAANLAATINGFNSLGVATGFGKALNSLTATPIALSGNGGAVLFTSIAGGLQSGSVPATVTWSVSAHATLTPSAALANGPGMVVAFFGAGGSTPTDPAVGTTVKANLKLRLV